MAQVVEVELVAKTDKAVDGVNKVEKAVEKTARSAKKASKELSGLEQGGLEVVKGLDRVTGGLASKFVAVGKAAKLSGKAMRTALISSGIGLAVAAVGLLVEYWDEIGEALGFINKDLERQVELNNQNLDAVGVRLRNIQTLIELRKREGKDVDLLLKKEKELTEQKKQAFITSIQDQALLLNRLKLKQQEGKLNEEETKELQKQEGVYLDLINNFNKFKSDLLEPVKEVVKKDTSVEDAKKAADEAEAAELARVNAIERIRKGLIDTEAEERAEKLRLIKEDYDQQIKLAAEFYGTNSIKILELKAAQKNAEDEQQALFNEQDKEKRLAKEEEDQEKLIEKLELNKEFDNLNFEEQRNLLNERDEQLLNDTTLTEEQRTALTKQFAEARTNLAVAETDAKLATLNAVGGGLADLSSIAGEETAAGKALALASATISTYAGIAGIWGAPPEGTATTTLIAKIAASIAVASAGFAAVKKIASTKVPATTGGGGGGGGGGATSYSPPSIPAAFNIVGASGETQLADAIGSQTQRPSRAFVVSNDVTTAQELDRNIIEGASI